MFPIWLCLIDGLSYPSFSICAAKLRKTFEIALVQIGSFSKTDEENEKKEDPEFDLGEELSIFDNNPLDQI